MALTVRTITRYSNGLTVYSNDGCQRTKRKAGNLYLAAHNLGAEEIATSSETVTMSTAPVSALAAGQIYPVSATAYLHDATLEPAASNFCYWLEEQYAESQMRQFGSKAPITVRDMPPPEVVDMAVSMLKRRGWVVIPPNPRTEAMNGPRTGTISMRQISY